MNRLAHERSVDPGSTPTIRSLSRALSAAEVRDVSYASGVRRVVSVEPIFVVSDVPRAVAHYEQLGFSTSHHDEGYAFAHRNELTIHLAGPGVEPERMGHGSIYMHVDDADALAEEWRDAGVDFIEPQDFEYGKREGSHQDPDGNLTRFRITSSALEPSARPAEGNDCRLGQCSGMSPTVSNRRAQTSGTEGALKQVGRKL